MKTGLVQNGDLTFPKNVDERMQLKLKNGEIFEHFSSVKQPFLLSELDSKLSFIIPAHEFLKIKHIPTPMFVQTTVSYWTALCDFIPH